MPTTGKVLVVAIDEKSIAELGQWPWSRILMAELIEELTRLGARVIGVDIVWPEPERRSGVLDVLYGESETWASVSILRQIKEELNVHAVENPKLDEFLRRVSHTVQPDRVLAEVIRKSNRVVLGDFLSMRAGELPGSDGGSGNEGALISLEKSQYPVVRSPGQVPHEPPVPKSFGFKGNVPVIGEAAKAVGYFNMLPDPDGVVRAAPLVISQGDRFLAPLALQVLRHAADASSWILELEQYGVAGIQWEGGWIPTSEEGFMIINYRGRARTFPYVSAVDVLRGRTRPKEIEDKIVLVGAVATGIFDLRVTPTDTVFPGVEVHATILDNILKGDYILRTGWVSLLDISVLLVLGIGSGALYPRLRPMLGAVLMLTAFLGHLYVNTQLLVRYGYWLNVIYPSLLIPLAYLGVAVYQYIKEEREKRRIKSAFQVYVAPAVVGQILKEPESLKLGGEKRILTVLFSDIRGFTGISERMAPEELVRLLNEYLTEMTRVVFRHEGTLDKYIGDAIMAIYGAPLPQEDHPLRACLTALEMLDAVEVLRGRWESQGLPSLEIGIGINTGEMVVGNMGSDRRFDYTVMGDHVNLASRLEGLNKYYGTRVLVSEFTAGHVEQCLLCREVDSVRVKGKARPVKIYEILPRPKDIGEAMTWIEVFLEGLELYRQRRWDEAMGRFRSVMQIRPGDGPSRIYAKRCLKFRENPPPSDWDGVHEWDSK